jgi:hypothetical protein
VRLDYKFEAQIQKRKAKNWFLTQRFETFSDNMDHRLPLTLPKYLSEEVNESLPRFGIGAVGVR